MKLVESGDVGWNEPDVAKVLGGVSKRQSLVPNHHKSFLNRNHWVMPFYPIKREGRKNAKDL